MRTIFIGPRDIPHNEALSIVRDALASCPWKDAITEVVHRGTKGIDNAAGEVCGSLYEVTEDHAEWLRLGKPAGPIRNQRMTLASQALIAVHDGESYATQAIIEMARGYGLKVFIHKIKSRVQKPAAGAGFGVG